MPPLNHVKSHDKSVIESLSRIEPAPNADGGFLPLRPEIKSELEFLNKKNELTQDEPIFVVAGYDAARLTNQQSATIFSVKAISTGTCIGIVGAVAGGDSYENMAKSATPFLRQVEELALNPVVSTDIGDIPVKIKIGGDLSSTYDLFGLGKAMSNCSCPCCVLPKGQFYLAALDERIWNSCNNAALGRTMANIRNEAKKSSNRAFSVKNSPLSRVPVNPTDLIVNWIIICLLHARMRLCGKYTNFSP